jgi:hypothetical protein
MTDWQIEVQESIKDFLTVAALAGDILTLEDFHIEFLPAPHKQPSNLPQGKMAVYAFWFNGDWLKIGKAGTKTKARFTSQHYNAGSAPSTLAASLVADQRMQNVTGFDKNSPGNWLKLNTCRANILISDKHRKEIISLLEVFLHARLRPRYEGKSI